MYGGHCDECRRRWGRNVFEENEVAVEASRILTKGVAAHRVTFSTRASIEGRSSDSEWPTNVSLGCVVRICELNRTDVVSTYLRVD